MSRLTIISITLPIILLVGFFFTWPQYQNVRNLGLEVQAKQNELQNKEEYFSKIKETSDELKNYEAEVSKIDSALPSDPFLPSLFNFLDKTANQNGLILKQLGSFSVVDSKAKPDIKEINIGITVSGSYPAFKNFLSALEKTARLVEVDDIIFSYPSAKETPSFDLVIKAHSY